MAPRTLRQALSARDVLEIQLTAGQVTTEPRPLHERHHLIQLIDWLMADLEPRLRMAWRAKAIRYNHLSNDFENAPAWYQKIAEGFADWRQG